MQTAAGQWFGFSRPGIVWETAPLILDSLGCLQLSGQMRESHIFSSILSSLLACVCVYIYRITYNAVYTVYVKVIFDIHIHICGKRFIATMFTTARNQK